MSNQLKKLDFPCMESCIAITMTKQITKTLPLITIIFLMNCATMFSENQYTYSITAEPNEADISVLDSNFVIDKLKTPCKLNVNMKREIILKVEAKGYSEKYVALEKGINGWVWANLILGGAAGIAIDFFTGSMYKPIDDKTEIKVILEPTIPLIPEKKGKKVSMLSVK